jgi:hypothetical protein
MEVKSFDKSDTHPKYDDPVFIEASWTRILTSFSLCFEVIQTKCSENIISLSKVKLNSHN